MVFTISINCTFNICADTGRHFYYTGRGEKIYDMPQVIPGVHREYVNMSGDVFEIYTRLVTDETSTSVDNFVDKYPDWTDIEAEDYTADWSEEKHNGFYRALEWLAEQKICYMIHWQ